MILAPGPREPDQALEHYLGPCVIPLTKVQPAQLVEHRAERGVLGAELPLRGLERFREESLGVRGPAEFLLELSELDEGGDALSLETGIDSRQLDRRMECRGRGWSIAAAQRQSRCLDLLPVEGSRVCHVPRRQVAIAPGRPPQAPVAMWRTSVVAQRYGRTRQAACWAADHRLTSIAEERRINGPGTVRAFFVG
jgi:hypothetical protein